MNLVGSFKLAFEDQVGRIEGKCGILKENYNISVLDEAERRLKDIINCFYEEKFFVKDLSKSPESIIWAMRLSVVRIG